jgi:hypothetical protein
VVGGGGGGAGGGGGGGGGGAARGPPPAGGGGGVKVDDLDNDIGGVKFLSIEGAPQNIFHSRCIPRLSIQGCPRVCK